MKYNPEIHHRRSIRLKGYDYSKAGAYFITIGTQNRECLFGNIADGKMVLNDAGKMIQAVWDLLPGRFLNTESDEFALMPNHIHGIIFLTPAGDRTGEPCVRPSVRPDSPGEHQSDEYNRGGQNTGGQNTGEHKVRPYGTLPDTVGRIVQAFKSITTHEYTSGVKQQGWTPFPGKLWQRNYWEHIVRNEYELTHIREYIRNNPTQWDIDKLNVGANTRFAPTTSNLF